MQDEPVPSEDPLDLEAVDREIRINELTEQVKELGEAVHFVSDDCPPEMHEQFLRNIIEHDKAPVTSNFVQLEERGIELPPPDALHDSTLHAKLWEVINALAQIDTYLYHTDHLSDRELYNHLWHESLREATAIMPPGSGWIHHIDLLGGGSEEDIENCLRYYDTEEQRQSWARDFPNDVIPPHEALPYDRDRHLPEPPPPPSFEYDGDDESDDE